MSASTAHDTSTLSSASGTFTGVCTVVYSYYTNNTCTLTYKAAAGTELR